jgi:spermidine synthase
LTASLLLTVWLGSQHAQQLLIALAAVSGLLLLAESKVSAVALVGAALVAGLLAFSVHPIPGLLVAYGRYTATQIGQSDIIYVGEGWNASVAVSERPNGVRNYHNAGKVQASSEPQDMRLQRMLGHLTTLVPENPKNVLVIGCGAGVTAGAVSIDPRLDRETIAEIEPLVPRVVSTYFSAHNFDVVRNPKVHVHVDDARHFLFTTREKFDAITSDPLDPWVKGAAMLYTEEFFELVKQHLNPGGVVTLFVQLYESNTEAVKSEVATFFEAFPKGMIFANLYNGAGYDLVLLGQVEGTHIDLDEMEARLQRPEYAPVAKSLQEIGMYSPVQLFATYGGSASDMQPWLRDAQINRDRNLRLQYLAGRGLNLYHADAIYAEMLPYAKDPDGVFTGSDRLLQSLLQQIRTAHGR